MTNEEIRGLCQTLRAEGVRRVRLNARGVVTFVEFFEQAAAIPTDGERQSAGENEPKTGHELALDLLRTGKAPETRGDA